MAMFTTDGKICIERIIEPRVLIQNDNISEAFDILKTCQWITENNFTKVCLQFPDELLNKSAEIYNKVKEKIDIDLYIVGDTSYESCCVDSIAASHVQANAVIHYGRCCFSKTNIPTLTVLPKKSINVQETMNTLNTIFPSDEETRLCLFYDGEFEHCKDDIMKNWFETYSQSYIASIELEEKENRFLGRILNNKDNDKLPVDILKDSICVYLGSRGQTLFTYTISVQAKKWYLLEADSKSIERMDETAWFKRRRYLVEKCKDANTIGILVCKFSGKDTRDIIQRMKTLCKVNRKKSYIVSVGRPNVAKLANFPEIDVYVMIACPENDLYSSRDFYKPIIYPYELEVALNSNRPQIFDTHIINYEELLPGHRGYTEISEPVEATDVSLITGKVREFKSNTKDVGLDVVEKKEWAVETIGQNLLERTWTGLEQKLGQTDVKEAEEGRKGIPLQYQNEPE